VFGPTARGVPRAPSIHTTPTVTTARFPTDRLPRQNREPAAADRRAVRGGDLWIDITPAPVGASETAGGTTGTIREQRD